MTNIKIFSVNDFSVNSFVIYDDTSECVLIDPGFFSTGEKEVLDDFLVSNALKPVMLLNTHCHVDHVLGNKFIIDKYKIPLATHKEDESLFKKALEHGKIFGFNIPAFPPIDKFLSDNDLISFGQSALQVLHVPGHSQGSIAFYCKQSNFVVVGDTLFNGSIGRTDFPEGNYDTLISSIKNKLMVLPGDTVVYPGHGPATTIKNEQNTNPFLQ